MRLTSNYEDSESWWYVEKIEIDDIYGMTSGTIYGIYKTLIDAKLAVANAYHCSYIFYEIFSISNDAEFENIKSMLEKGL